MFSAIRLKILWARYRRLAAIIDRLERDKNYGARWNLAVTRQAEIGDKINAIIGQ